jgi:hypothetical protein
LGAVRHRVQWSGLRNAVSGIERVGCSHHLYRACKCTESGDGDADGDGASGYDQDSDDDNYGDGSAARDCGEFVADRGERASCGHTGVYGQRGQRFGEQGRDLGTVRRRMQRSDMRLFVRDVQRLRDGNHVHRASERTESSDGDADGDVGVRYHKVGSGDDYGNCGTICDRGELVANHDKRARSGNTRIYSDGDERHDEQRCEVGDIWNRLHRNRQPMRNGKPNIERVRS